MADAAPFSPAVPDVRAVPVAHLTSAQAADAMTRAFEGYLVPLRMTPEAFERRFRGEHLDPFASRVLFRGEEPAGVLLVTRRGWTSRIGGMAIAPALRGRGLGRRAMELAVAEARARGERAVLLEVFEQNAAARALYESLGFCRVRRLCGWRFDGAPPARAEGEARRDAAALAEIDPLELSRVVAREGEPGLPWMLAAETLASVRRPARAYHLEGRAFAVVADPAAEAPVLPVLVVPREHRRRGWGTRMVRALRQQLGGRALVAQAIVPEELAPGFFAALGAERQPLHQIEMRLDLAPD